MTVEESLVYDVVVIGGGGAGLAAALAAAESGASTLLLERRDRLGGSTAISIGSFTAAGTRWQRRRGIADTPTAFLEDMAQIAGVKPEADAPELRSVLAVEAARTLDWLADIGVPFVGPFPEPPHRVPRMHNVVPDSRMYIACLSRAVRRAGVRVMLRATARALVSDRAGGIAGVDVEIGGHLRRIMAERGVILATGDFSGNPTMRREYLSAAAADSVPANPDSTGDGHRLALAVGAKLVNMDVTTGPKLRFPASPRRGIVARLPLWPPLMKVAAAIVQVAPAALLRPYVKAILVAHMQPSPKLFEHGAILVNIRGARFCDETSSTVALAHQPDATGYLVFGEETARKFNQFPNFVSTAPGIAYAYMRDYERVRPDLIHRAGTAAELAQKLGMDPKLLEKSVHSASPRIDGPLRALGPIVSTVTVTEGGVAVDCRCQVLRQDGSPIPGLFAAGGVGQGGMRLAGHGLHIGWAMTSGRLAGQEAARRMPRSVRQGTWSAAFVADSARSAV